MNADTKPQDRGEDAVEERGEQRAEGGSILQQQEPGQAPLNEAERRDAETLAIWEAARNRLTEIRRREREQARLEREGNRQQQRQGRERTQQQLRQERERTQQQLRQERERTRQQQREERDRERAEVARQRDERRLEQLQIMQQRDEAPERSETSDQSEEVRQWLERHRQQREEEARRKEELAQSRDEQRRNARTRRQESDMSTPRRRRVPGTGSTSHNIATEPVAAPVLTSSEMVEKQKEALSELVETADAAFEAKRDASARREWCNPIPIERKVETVQTFLKAFHDENDMEIATCSVCYMKKKPRDLDQVHWRRAIPEEVRIALAGLLMCKTCFPESDEATSIVPICSTCRAAFDHQRVPDACMGSTMHIGCEHRYPDQLRDLTPLEEKLISLNAAYGFITKFNIQRGQLTGPSYRKHVAGHITVFPNDVESLAATILPHPLVSTLDQIHVIWTGVERPMPVDVGKLLSVRPAILRAALGWLRANNPLYAGIAVNEAEIESWSFEEGSNVPQLAYQRMVREQETAEELIRTAQIVPPSDRGQLSPARPPVLEEIIAGLEVISETTDTRTCSTEGEPTISLEEATAEETSNQVFELRSSAMFQIDEQSSFEEQDKLEFINLALRTESNTDGQYGGGIIGASSMKLHNNSRRPFLQVMHGRNFADAFSPDFFPKTLPSCFPFGRGGPQVVDSQEPSCGLLRDMTLESWAKVVLQRQGGRCAQHPAFSFLVFNLVTRSRNRRVAQGRVKRSAFRHIEQIYQDLTAEQVRDAQAEMYTTGRTTDVNVLALMKELSLYGCRHPLSNESRLSMRKKIQSMIIAFGLTAIWFTINPNDISNPVRLKLATHRVRQDKDAAASMLLALQTSHQITSFAIHDPLSSALFFFREISLFFEHYVRVGRPSIYGKVSHYYATIETNDRGALHLHGLLWLDANLAMADLVRDLADPREEQYRTAVKSFVDDVFSETLNDNLAKDAAAHGKKTTVVEPLIMDNSQWLSQEFDREANFVASRCQVHHHSATCVKYSFKAKVKAISATREIQLCRFRAPWRLVRETGFTDDGILEVKRDHSMVNQYNQSMAIGLRHNHDISLILTRKKGLALIHYINNYATKLNAPMWKRLALAAELMELDRTKEHETATSDVLSTIHEQTRSFLLRVSNRIFTSRELSQPEVLSYLLGFGTDFTNVSAWTWVHLNSLYWACARQWPALCQALVAIGREPHAESLYFQADGLRLPYMEAYKFRGPLLQDLCLYDYLAFVVLRKQTAHQRGSVTIPFPCDAISCTGWVQCLRTSEKAATPTLDGRLTDDFDEENEKFIKWNAVVHLALFVPWERFCDRPAVDISGLWQSLAEGLSDRLRHHIRNVSLLRVSAEDAAADRKLRGIDQDFEEIMDATALEEHDQETAVCLNDENIELERRLHYEAFLGVLSAFHESEINDSPLSSALKTLSQEVTRLNVRSESSLVEGERPSCPLPQALRTSSGHSAEPLGREELEAILKLQRKENASVTANIQGVSEEGLHTCAEWSVDSSDDLIGLTSPGGLGASETRSEPRMRLQVGPYMSYIDVALTLVRQWTLNKLQALAVLLPAAFLDERGTQLQEMEGKQHFQYVGGEGGTGKSRVIHVIRNMFKLKGGTQHLLLTGASGNAAALIGGVTLHSACNIGFEGSSVSKKSISEEEKLRWKSKVMLIVDEISQVGGLTLASVDSRMRLYREDEHRPFGGIPIVLFFGDFYQFDPVLQTSLLLPKPRVTYKQNPESMARHVAAHKLFLQFTQVVILRDQVRTAGCPRLREFLQRLRQGEQTEADFEQLCRRLYDQHSQPSFVDGSRAITPLNQERWSLNMAAVLEWARARRKHISIFAARHSTERGRRLSVQDLCDVLRHGDDSQLPTPGLFFYAQGMPVVVTRNQLTGLKIVNGAVFHAVDIFPDASLETIALAGDVTLHLGPPEAVLLQSDSIADLAIPGLPPGTILIKSQTVAIPEPMRGRGARSQGKPGFKWVTHRTGALCTPAFAMTDQKSQGKQFSEVLLNLKGVHGGSTATRPSFMSLYVQLSRAERWEGLHLFRRPSRSDFIEPRNVLDEEMRNAIQKLEVLGDQTQRRFESDHERDGWLQAWLALPDSNADGHRQPCRS